jgi:hypothetical protein
MTVCTRQHPPHLLVIWFEFIHMIFATAAPQSGQLRAQFSLGVRFESRKVGSGETDWQRVGNKTPDKKIRPLCRFSSPTVTVGRPDNPAFTFQPDGCPATAVSGRIQPAR